MSNVLIGIVGVILLIGLALAGALFLGPRFQEAANTSRAVAALQSLKQIGDAVDMYSLQKGTIPAGTDGTAEAVVNQLVAEGYLRAVPRSPFASGNTRVDTSLRHVIGELPSQRSTDLGLCQAISRQTGSPKAVWPDGAGLPPPTVRSFCVSYDEGGAQPEYDVVYRY